MHLAGAVHTQEEEHTHSLVHTLTQSMMISCGQSHRRMVIIERAKSNMMYPNYKYFTLNSSCCRHITEYRFSLSVCVKTLWSISSSYNLNRSERMYR